MNTINPLIYILIFPGFLFLVAYGLLLEWIDRILLAKFQNRVGPPWFQPFADFVKLFAKEDIIPKLAEKTMFSVAPALALAAVFTTIIFLPTIISPLHSFNGDIVVIAYLLTIPTFSIFLGGWYSSNFFASIGAMRANILLFSYEVPLLMSLLGPAMVANSWSVQGVLNYQLSNSWFIFSQPIGFLVMLIALVGKLERIPFDIPEAETEIVEGPFCEYTGRKLALYRLMFDVELVIGAILISTIYLGGFSSGNLLVAILVFVLKTLMVLFAVSLCKAALGRIRIDQMVAFCWKFLVPAAVLQYVLIILFKFHF